MLSSFLKTMNVYPANDEGQNGVNRRWILSKSSVYMLHMLNWIPPLSKRKYIFSFLVFFTVTIHICGFILIVVDIGGLASSEVAPVVPAVLAYTFGVEPMYSVIHSVIFLSKSWITIQTANILNAIEEQKLSHMWPIRYKIYSLVMTSYVIWAVINYVYKDELRKAMTYHYIKRESVKNVLFLGDTMYRIYLCTIYYIFPAYIGYLCTCIHVALNHLRHLLEEKKKDNETNKQNFDCFT